MVSLSVVLFPVLNTGSLFIYLYTSFPIVLPAFWVIVTHKFQMSPLEKFYYSKMVFCFLPALDASSLVLRLSPLTLCLVSNASAPPLCLICGSVVNFTGVSFPGHFLWAMCSYNVLLRANYAENIRVTHTALYSTLIHSILQYSSTSVNIHFGFWIFWASVSPVLGSA